MRKTVQFHAGDERPAFIIGQELEKGRGQTTTVQGSRQVPYAVKPGDVGFPNMTEAWGVRLTKDGKVPSSPLSVTDNNYDGKIEWLEWGDKRGCAIVARWLSGYNTLDYQYQKLVLRADDKLKDSFEDAFIVLQTGINEVESNNTLKLQHLRIHNQNRDSKSKNPECYSYMFFEKNEEVEQEKAAKDIDKKFEAISIVKKAAKDTSLNALRSVKTAVSKMIAEEVEDEKLYTTLLNLADSDPDAFIGQVDEYKKFMSNTFVKAQSFKLLDLTKEGTILAGKDQKEIIGKDIPAKGDKMIEYILENWYEEQPNKIFYSIKAITDKIN